MKKTGLIFIFALFAVVHLVSAQGWKVETGKMEYKDGNFESAIESITEALEEPDKLKGKKLAEAHVYLALSYARLSQDEKYWNKYPDAGLKGYSHYKQGKLEDSKIGGRYGKDLTLAKEYLWRGLFNRGAKIYGQEDFKTAKEYFDKTVELAPDQYQPQMLLGYANFLLQDTVAAIGNWEKTLDLYRGLKLDKPDASIASVYLSLTDLYVRIKNDPRKALKLIEEGKKLFPNNADLDKSELFVYQQAPDLFEEAVAKFETAIEANPKDTKLAVAFANLLEKNGKESDAINVYKKVLEKEPQNYYANANLGVFYINKASTLKAQYDSADANNESLMEKLSTQIKDELTAALPYIQQAHASKPKDKEWIKQLWVITSNLGMEEESKKWEEKMRQ